MLTPLGQLLHQQGIVDTLHQAAVVILVMLVLLLLVGVLLVLVVLVLAQMGQLTQVVVLVEHTILVRQVLA
jgi:hypothetical protein